MKGGIMADVIIGIICFIVGLIVLFSPLPAVPRIIICVGLIVGTKILSDYFGGDTPQ